MEFIKASSKSAVILLTLGFLVYSIVNSLFTASIVLLYPTSYLLLINIYHPGIFFTYIIKYMITIVDKIIML